MAITTPGFDERYSNNNQYPIARGNRGGGIDISVNAGLTTGEKQFVASGQLLGFVYEAPDLATDTAWSLDILDMDGIVWYSKGSIPDNGKGIVWVIDTASRFLAGQHKCRVTFSTAQAGNVSFTVIPILK